MNERYGSQLKDVDEQLSVIKEEIKEINKKTQECRR
jgi:hypothetical protein